MPYITTRGAGALAGQGFAAQSEPVRHLFFKMTTDDDWFNDSNYYADILCTIPAFYTGSNGYDSLTLMSDATMTMETLGSSSMSMEKIDANGYTLYMSAHLYEVDQSGQSNGYTCAAPVTVDLNFNWYEVPKNAERPPGYTRGLIMSEGHIEFVNHASLSGE